MASNFKRCERMISVTSDSRMLTRGSFRLSPKISAIGPRAQATTAATSSATTICSELIVAPAKDAWKQELVSVRRDRTIQYSRDRGCYAPPHDGRGVLGPPLSRRTTAVQAYPPAQTSST